MSMHRLTLRSITLVVFETLLIVTAVTVAAYIRLGNWSWLFTNTGILKTLVVAVVAQACLYYSDLYDLRLVADRRELFVRVVQALAAASFLLALVYYWFEEELLIGRGVFAIAAVFVITLAIGWRLVFVWLSRRVSPRERLLLVGTSAAAVTLAQELFDRRDELGVEIVGFVDPDPTKVGTSLINPGIVGTIDEIPDIVRNRSVDRVVVSLVDARGKLPMDKLLDMKLNGVTFDHLASVYEEYTGKIAVDNLRPSWLIFSSGFKKSHVLATAKRALDLFVAGVGLVVALPLMLTVALAVKLASKGPILYHQSRVGLNGKLFTVHKFRTMRPDAEAASGPVWASKAGDPRVTPIGRMMRRTRLDELPQLWNVLIGEMSFVGPRPERPEFVSELTQQIPYYGQRHVVRPGLTGWAQVRYTYGASTEDALQKLQYDLFYIKNLSLSLDLFIILETVKTVVLRRGA
jgi:sugar transferase (PEP-CTERM system associated)